MIDDLFSEYETITRKADILFHTVKEKYPNSVRCRIRCCDCCHAVFGVFPIEAAFINYHFNRLERKIRRDILRRAEKGENDILKAKDILKVFEEDPKMKIYGLGKQRVRCPFLSDRDECQFYENRPVICRIYGIPYSLEKDKKTRSFVCGLSAFEEKATYPTVKLDKIYDQLCQLSLELLKEGRAQHAETKASLMIPLSRVLRMPFKDIIEGKFQE